jgi:hypothetical protein
MAAQGSRMLIARRFYAVSEQRSESLRTIDAPNALEAASKHRISHLPIQRAMALAFARSEQQNHREQRRGLSQQSRLPGRDCPRKKVTKRTGQRSAGVTGGRPVRGFRHSRFTYFLSHDSLVARLGGRVISPTSSPPLYIRTQIPSSASFARGRAPVPYVTPPESCVFTSWIGSVANVAFPRLLMTATALEAVLRVIVGASFEPGFASLAKTMYFTSRSAKSFAVLFSIVTL